MKRVVITGSGILSPVGIDAKSAWNALCEGQSGISKISNVDASKFPVQIAGELKNFNVDDHISPKEQRRIDRFMSLGLIASSVAVEEAGIANIPEDDSEKVAVLLSSGIGGLIKIEESIKTLDEGKKMGPFYIPGIISNLLPGHLSMKYGFRGANFCVTSACSSSAHSIGEGFRMIQRGEIDFAVVGGAEAPIVRTSILGFAAMKALSKRNDAPEKASRPFDTDRDGFVMGEGAVTLILEDFESAKKRGANILAEVVGYAANADANHMTAPHPEGKWAASCMSRAIADAKIDKSQVGYINMHGTSTPVGDVAETIALKAVFGSAKKTPRCSSTKSMTGHLLGAAGSMEAWVCAMALKDQIVPPTINLDNQDPQCDLDYTAHTAKECDFEYALSNSFGFGGTNASLVLKKFS